MDDIKAFYEKTAEAWAESGYGDDSLRPYLRRFLDMLPPNPRVLDLCCGAGYESRRMHEMGAQVVGIDISPRSIEIARARNKELTFYTGDMLKDYSHIGLVDGIAVIAGLIHVPEDKLGTAFIQMAKVLKKGGRVLIVTREGTGKDLKRSHMEVDGIRYDRPFYLHTLDEMLNSCKEQFQFVTKIVLDNDAGWSHYIMERI